MTTEKTTTAAVERADLEKLACQIEDMIEAADEAGEVRLSRRLNRALEAIEQAINC